MDSTSGLRPPWTQKTAPPPVRLEPVLSPDAPVPVGPFLDGVFMVGDDEEDEEASRSFSTALSPSRNRRFRGNLVVTSLLAFMISTSMSSSSGGSVVCVSRSAVLLVVGSRFALVPSTKAPSAR